MSADLVVNLSVSEQPGSDYVAPGDKGADTVTILMGTSSITYMVPTVDDMIVEENGLFRVTVGSSTADPATYAVAAGSSGYADIIMSDNDFPVISVNFPLVDGLPIRQIGGNSHAIHKEATEEVTFEVISTPAPSSALTVCLNVTESGGSRLSSTSKGAKTVTIPANATSVDYDVTWSDDTDDEVYSLIKVTGVDPADASCSQTGYELPLSGTSDQALVEDNDPTVVSLARIGTGAVTEGTAIEFTVTLGRALVAGERIEVPYTVSGTNVVAADWSVALKPGNGINTGVTDTNSGNTQLLHFNAGARVATVLLTPTVDDTTEGSGSETYTIALGNNAAFDARPSTLTNVGGGADPSSTANTFNVVVNDNAIPVISIRRSNYSSVDPNLRPSRTEGGLISWTLTADPAFASGRRVTFDVTDAPNADYVPSGNQGARHVNFSKGETTKNFSFLIPQDTTDEPNGPITVTLTGGGTSYTIDSSLNSDYHPITDNDPTTVTLEVTDALAEEGSGANNPAVITLTLGRDLRAGEVLAVPLQFSGGVQNTNFLLHFANTNTIDLSGHTVTFTGGATGSGTVATISMLATEDANTTDETVIVSIPASSSTGTPRMTATGLGGGATGSRTGNGEITLDDDDIPTAAPMITIAPTTANTPVTEGAAASFTITATTPSGTTVPARTVNLTVADAPNADFVSSTNQQGTKTVSIPSSSTNTSTATYTVATEGGNSETTDEPSGPVTVTIATGTGYTGTGSASITVNDNDATPVTLARSGGTSAIGEDGGTATLTVTLGRALRANEILAVPLQFSGGVLNTDFALASTAATGVALSGSTVTFTGSSGGSAPMATVTLTASPDADADDDSIIVSIPAASTGNAPILTATGLDGGATGSGSITLPVTDGDSRGLTLTSPAVTEGGSGMYTVKLNTQPSAAVTVTVAVPANTDLTLDGADADTTFTNSEDLIFTTTNWNQTQTVTIRAAEDDDTTDDAVILTHSAASGGYGSVSQNLNVTITDNDSPALALPASLTVNEGATGDYTVRLSNQPSGAVTVTVAVPANTDVTIDGPDAGATFSASEVLNFTTSNWNQTQIVTVRAGQDDDRTDDVVTLAHTATGGGYNTITGNVAITITDTTPAPTPVTPPSTQPGTTPIQPDPSPTPPGETPTEPQEPEPEPEPVIPLLSIAAQSDSVTEGAPATFTVTTDPAPLEPISVSLTIVAQGDFTAAQSTGVKTLTIDRATTSLMIPTIQDFIDEADGSVTVTLQAADGYSLATDSATIAIHDDDTAGIEWSTQGIRIDQIGETGQYTVQLTSQPTSPVTVTVMTPSAIVTVSPLALTFTPDNWNIPQPFTLTAQQEGSVTLVHAITSQDPHYDAMHSQDTPLRIVVGEDLTAVALPWQTRFVRTQAGQVLDRISDRIQSTSTPGLSAKLAGYRMDTTPPQDMQSRWTQNPVPEAHSRTVTMSELLSDSSMSWTTATNGSIASLWAQGAFSEFDGQSGETTLDGEVLTTLIGVDQTHARGQRGLVLSYSQAEGDYQTKNKGEIESTHTLFTPWMSQEVNDHLTIWGALGYGAGDLTLIRRGREDLTTDTNTAFVAAGSDAILQEEANRTLSVVTDVLWLRTRTEAVADGLELNNASAHVSRMRAGLEGRWRKTLERFPRFRGQNLEFHLETALRHDGGDAESGFGMEVGGGFQWTHPRHGLDLAINGRALITHHDSDLKDRGLSISMGFDPSPANQGFTFTLKQDWGTASSGRERLLDAEPIQKTESDTSGRLTAQAGYGFTVREGRYTTRPVLGVGLSGEDRETSLGWRLESITGRSNRTLGLKLTRHENDNQSEHRMKVEAGVRW